MASHRLASGRARSRRTVVAIAATVSSLLAAGVVENGPAGAAVPGANGRIACEGERSEFGLDVFTINPDGTDERVLTADNSIWDDGDPSWSPDGTKLAFESTREGSYSDVWVMNADGTGVTHLAGRPLYRDRGTSWSPDGTEIAFHSGGFLGPDDDGGPDGIEVMKMNADGSDQVRLTENVSLDALPSWSPDGTKIAFNSARDGDVEIYVMDADGTDPTRLTFLPGEDAHPVWSPDGSQIAFHGYHTTSYELYVMNADGSDVRQLTDTPWFEVFPVWSPDGTKISYTGNTLDPFNIDVYVMNVDGTDLTRLTSTPGWDGRCDWGVLSPFAKADCKDDGWRRFNTATFERFKNQGDCIAFVHESEENRL